MENLKKMPMPYYIGFNVGTNSVGWAVTDKEYNLLKHGGEPEWGVNAFDPAESLKKRGVLRRSRRTLNRKNARVVFTRCVFEKHIIDADPDFFLRLDASGLQPDDRSEEDMNSLFNDDGFTDREYYKKYRTIHHLICELMQSDEPHDARLVYLACAWLMSHRGHFLNEVDRENIQGVLSFDRIYDELKDFILSMSDDYTMPWSGKETEIIREILPKKISISLKYKILKETLSKDGNTKSVSADEFPCSVNVMLKALCGSKIKTARLFLDDSFNGVEAFSLGDETEILEYRMQEIEDIDEDAAQIIRILKKIYDWSLLTELLDGCTTISEAKVKMYDKHHNDLQDLKYVIKKYAPSKYGGMFRDGSVDSYTAYSGYCRESKEIPVKWATRDSFYSRVKKIIESIEPQDEDRAVIEKMLAGMETGTFMPKQVSTKNAVIPYQLYWYELRLILENAKAYLPFLAQLGQGGKLTAAEELLAVHSFKLPYYIGPLDAGSEHAWIKRKTDDRIMPWNLADVVDLDGTEDGFIRRMLGKCTYVLGEMRMPKNSIIYQRYCALNSINKIKVNGEPISVELKKDIYNDVFCRRKNVDYKAIAAYLNGRGICNESGLSGIDQKYKASMRAYHDFKRYLDSGTLTEDDAERIIERITYTNDRDRLEKWLSENYGFLDEKQRHHISRFKYEKFGNLSAFLLTGIRGGETGKEEHTIMEMLWDTNCNLMELLSKAYTFSDKISERNRAFENLSAKGLMDRMYLSSTVKKPVHSVLDIAAEIRKVEKRDPEKIFIKMARGDKEAADGKTRYKKIQEVYNKSKKDTALLRKQLEGLGEDADTKLQNDRLYLYFLQFGKSMYSGKALDMRKIENDEGDYDIDHIYPQNVVGSDHSLINNKILCFKEENQDVKKDMYPLPEDFMSQKPFWISLWSCGAISDEKYARLIRRTPFSEKEMAGFAEKQLVETRQTAKALVALLQQAFPNSEIVCLKSKNVSEFRNEFEILKARLFNDLHPAKDAYLNIVVGNVLSSYFAWAFFQGREKKRTMKIKTIFGDTVRADRGGIYWNGASMREKVKTTAGRNNARYTYRSYKRGGKLYKVTILKKKEGLVPVKNGRPTEKYGGYNSTTATAFVLVKFSSLPKKVYDVALVAVELMHYDRFIKDRAFADKYIRKQIRIFTKKADDIQVLLGGRMIKPNTRIELDGVPFLIKGKENNGKAVSVSLMVPFSAGTEWQNYVHHLDSYVRKCRNNKSLKHDGKHDKINHEKNIELYDVCVDKLKNSIYKKRMNNRVEDFIAHRNDFIKLGILEQAETLLNMLMVFGGTSNGIDFSHIGMPKHAASTKIQANLSLLGKHYSDFRIVDMSPAGMWVKKSENLFEYLNT